MAYSDYDPVRQRLRGTNCSDGVVVWAMDWHSRERRVNWSIRMLDAVVDIPEEVAEQVADFDIHYLYYGNIALGRINCPRNIRLIKKKLKPIAPVGGTLPPTPQQLEEHPLPEEPTQP